MTSRRRKGKKNSRKNKVRRKRKSRFRMKSVSARGSVKSPKRRKSRARRPRYWSRMPFPGLSGVGHQDISLSIVPNLLSEDLLNLGLATNDPQLRRIIQDEIKGRIPNLSLVDLNWLYLNAMRNDISWLENLIWNRHERPSSLPNSHSIDQVTVQDEMSRRRHLLNQPIPTLGLSDREAYEIQAERLNQRNELADYRVVFHLAPHFVRRN